MGTASEYNAVIDQIVWPEPPPLKDVHLWRMNVALVKALCRLGTVTLWIRGEKGKDIYTNMPYHYDIDGVEIEFLPHWGYYAVGGFDLGLPGRDEEILSAIAAAKNLHPKIAKPERRF